MGQHLIDVIEETKARGRCLQALQPQGVPTHPQKLSRVQVHQVVAVMSRSSLEEREKGSLEIWETNIQAGYCSIQNQTRVIPTQRRSTLFSLVSYRCSGVATTAW